MLTVIRDPFESFLTKSEFPRRIPVEGVPKNYEEISMRRNSPEKSPKKASVCSFLFYSLLFYSCLLLFYKTLLFYSSVSSCFFFIKPSFFFIQTQVSTTHGLPVGTPIVHLFVHYFFPFHNRHFFVAMPKSSSAAASFPAFKSMQDDEWSDSSGSILDCWDGDPLPAKGHPGGE